MSLPVKILILRLVIVVNEVLEGVLASKDRDTLIEQSATQLSNYSNRTALVTLYLF